MNRAHGDQGMRATSSVDGPPRECNDPVDGTAGQAHADESSSLKWTFSDRPQPIRYSLGRDKFDSHPHQCEAQDFDTFEAAVLGARSRVKGQTYVCAPCAPDRNPEQEMRHIGKPHRGKDFALPRRWLAFDLDGCRGTDAWNDIRCFLDGVHRAFWYTTASHSVESPRARIVVELDREVTRDEGVRLGVAIEARIRAFAGEDCAKFDRSTYRGEQPIYTPLHSAETGSLPGAPLPVDEFLLDAPPAVEARGSVQERAQAIASNDPVVAKFRNQGAVLRELEPGKLAVVCPFDSEHSDKTSDSSTVYLLPRFNGVLYGKVHCKHAHCANRPQESFLRQLGLEPHAVWRAHRGESEASRSNETEPPPWLTEGQEDWPPLGGNNYGVATDGAREPGCEPPGTVPPEPKPPTFVRVGDETLRAADLPAPGMVIEPLIPRGVVTLLTGHGGSGKSNLAETLGAHVASGRAWAGFNVEQGKVLLVSAEDPGSVVAWRLQRILKQYDLPIDDVLANIVLVDASDNDASLAIETSRAGVRSLLLTGALDELDKLMQGVTLVFIDNASDVFGGDENSRRQVRALVRALGQLARKHNAAVVLIAHIDKAAARHGSNGDSYSGSTAWHNSSRSRIALVPTDDAGLELRHEKANFTVRADPVPMEWCNGVLMPRVRSRLVEGVAADNDADALLRALAAAEQAGLHVPAAMAGPSQCFHVLQLVPEYERAFPGKAGKKRAQAALIALRRRGGVKVVQFMGSGRHLRERLALAQSGMDGPQNAPVTAPEISRVISPIPPAATRAGAGARASRASSEGPATGATRATGAERDNGHANDCDDELPL